MYINRGNHEAKEMNRTYGFEGEAKHKFSEQTYKVYVFFFLVNPLTKLLFLRYATQRDSSSLTFSLRVRLGSSHDPQRVRYDTENSPPCSAPRNPR